MVTRGWGKGGQLGAGALRVRNSCLKTNLEELQQRLLHRLTTRPNCTVQNKVGLPRTVIPAQRGRLDIDSVGKMKG